MADGGTEDYLNVPPIDITTTLLRGSKNGGVNYPTGEMDDSFYPINTPINYPPPIKFGTLPLPSLPAAQQQPACSRRLQCFDFFCPSFWPIGKGAVP